MQAPTDASPDAQEPDAQEPGAQEPGPRPISPAAERALAEAAARRALIDARAAAISAAPERQGRGGLEPVRYDDWEVKGLAVDF